MTPEILKLFPEAIFKYKFEDFENYNLKLKKYIYELQKVDKEGIHKSNKGGWHSPPFNLKITNSIQQKFALALKKYILNTFQNLGWKTKNKDVQIEMWAIINKENDFNLLHIHRNAFLSAAYYVQTPKNCGKFLTEHPNTAKTYHYPEIENHNELNAIAAGVEVSEGDLIIFPGYLPHKVPENKSNMDRIVISFNVNIK